MLMSFGGETPNEPATMRARDWPCLRQFGVFLENRVGALNDLLRHLESPHIRVVALSIVDSVDCAVARLVMNNYEHACERLKFSEFPVFETDVIGVELPDTEQPHVSLFTALMTAEMNVHYTHPLMYRRNGRGAVALHVDDIDAALKVLGEHGHRIITEDDLANDDEYFG